MSATLLREVFVEFCESTTHLDSLLSRVPAPQKSKIARSLGVFLRRPLTTAQCMGIELAANEHEFWSLGFLKLKKSKKVHELLGAIWEVRRPLPADGGVIDFPPSMIQGFKKEWGDEIATQMARLLSQDPLTTLRMHRSAFQSEGKLVPELEAWLKEETLPKSRTGNYSPFARVFKGFAKVQQNDFFRSGKFEIQDEGSQVMSRYVLDPEIFAQGLTSAPQVQKPQKKMSEFESWARASAPLTVIDACSGAGGKTLALADYMGGKGRIFAYDIYPNKIRALKERVDRAQERNVQGVVLGEKDSEALTKDTALEKFHHSADRVLVDAPCTGLGVLRRNPDIKWNRVPLSVKEAASEMSIQDLQKKILDTYAPLVKPGGNLIYGVCTFSKSESIDQVESFLNRNAEFTLESSGFIGPFDTDGFFMASMKRAMP